MACPDLQYFSTLSHKRHDFGKKKRLLNIKCVFWFSLQLLSETFLILRIIQRDKIKKMHIGLHVKYPLFLSDLDETWIFSTHFRKLLKYQISWKFVQRELSCSMRTEWRTDGQTDMTKLIVAFRNFANAPKSDNWPLVVTWNKAFPYIRFKCHALKFNADVVEASTAGGFLFSSGVIGT
jgi:hypothetical protein